jgi:hypothetical protein
MKLYINYHHESETVNSCQWGEKNTENIMVLMISRNKAGLARGIQGTES